MGHSHRERGTPSTVATPEVSRLVRRQRVFLVLVSMAAVLATAGLVASLFIKSPAQQAAEASPPPASVLTAEVKREVLMQSVVVRGTVASSAQFSVTGKLGRSGGPAVLTKLDVATGSSATEGQQLAEISGEPLFAFQGAVPAYRDVSVGTRGDDADQLQKALQRLGYLSSVSDDKTFTWRAGRALRAFMQDRGYEAANDGDGNAILPLAQLVFLPSTPATVAAVNGAVGDDLSALDKPLLSVTTGDLRVSASVPEGSQNGITPGQEVEITDDVRGRSVKGSVVSLGDFSGNAKSNDTTQSTPGYLLIVAAADPLSSDWLGQNVKVTIVVARRPQPELVLPVTAIATKEKGDTFVTVVGSDGSRTQVQVKVSLISGGDAAVTPMTADSLHESDDVLVG